MLEPVRESYRTDESLRWHRVYNLPGFVYFDHSIHVQKGVGCASCHGRVDQMPFTYQVPTLLMEWCLDCHRDPAGQIRPREEVFNMKYQPPGNQLELGRKLVKQYKVKDSTRHHQLHDVPPMNSRKDLSTDLAALAPLWPARVGKAILAQPGGVGRQRGIPRGDAAGVSRTGGRMAGWGEPSPVSDA